MDGKRSSKGEKKPTSATKRLSSSRFFSAPCEHNFVPVSQGDRDFSALSCSKCGAEKSLFTFASANAPIETAALTGAKEGVEGIPSLAIPTTNDASDAKLDYLSSPRLQFGFRKNCSYLPGYAAFYRFLESNYLEASENLYFWKVIEALKLENLQGEELVTEAIAINDIFIQDGSKYKINIPDEVCESLGDLINKREITITMFDHAQEICEKFLDEKFNGPYSQSDFYKTMKANTSAELLNETPVTFWSPRKETISRTFSCSNLTFPNYSQNTQPTPPVTSNNTNKEETVQAASMATTLPSGSPNLSPRSAHTETFDHLVFCKSLLKDFNSVPLFLSEFEDLNDDEIRCIFECLDVNNATPAFIKQIIHKEVNSTNSFGTLFRANSTNARIVKLFLTRIAHPFVVDILRAPMVKILKNGGSMEIFEDRITTGTVKSNYENVKKACLEILQAILQSVDKIPPFLRHILNYFLVTAKKRFKEVDFNIAGNFFFLRVVNPVIVLPRFEGLDNDSLTPEIRRGLLFISKIFQNMSSNAQFTTMSKEQEMMIFNSLISKHLPKFKAYLEILSSDTPHYFNSKVSESIVASATSIHKLYEKKMEEKAKKETEKLLEEKK